MAIKIMSLPCEKEKEIKENQGKVLKQSIIMIQLQAARNVDAFRVYINRKETKQGRAQ